MKKINLLLAVPAIFLAFSCSDSLDALTGMYDMDRYVFDNVTVGETEKLGQGVKALNLEFSDGSNTLSVSFGSNDWTLQSGTYSLVSEISAKNQYIASLNGRRDVASGEIDVTLVGDTYYVSGLLTDNSGTRFKADYKGSLEFVIGEDDVEASGYTFTVTESEVVGYDASYQPVTYEDITKYAFTISDADGNVVAYLETVNDNDLDYASLAGTYTVQSGAYEAGLIEAGYAYAAYYAYGGSYVVSSGSNVYITSGTVTISVAEDAEGTQLYSFSGTDVTGTTDSLSGTSESVSLDIRYAAAAE